MFARNASLILSLGRLPLRWLLGDEICDLRRKFMACERLLAATAVVSFPHCHGHQSRVWQPPTSSRAEQNKGFSKRQSEHCPTRGCAQTACHYGKRKSFPELQT